MAEEFLRFERDLPAERGKKTQVWEVISARHGYRLGEIRWYGRWRQYTFRPEPETIWNSGCLKQLQSFVSTLNVQHRTRA